MRSRTMFRMFTAIFLIASLSVLSVNAATEETVNWDGNDNVEIIVPGFIEGGRMVEVGNGETATAIVIEKPAPNNDGRYTFFEIVTTDPDAVQLTANVYTAEFDGIGDYMTEFEDGRVSYTPFLYADLDEVSEQPLYLGFTIRNSDFEVIYECPLWVVFEDAGTSAPTPEPTPETTTEPTPEPTPEPTTEPVPVKEVTAEPTPSKVIVDNQNIAFEAYSIDGYNYFKLRDLAMAVTGSEKQFEVTWDGETNAMNLVSGEAYTSVGNELTAGTGAASVKGITNQSKIYVDGEEIALEAYTIDGNNYFKLRDVAAIFDFGVTWDGELNQIVIDTAAGYIE